MKPITLPHGLLRAARAVIAVGACALVMAGCEGTSTPGQPSRVVGLPASPTSITSPSATAWVPPTALIGTPIPGAEATLAAAPPLKTETLVITNSRGSQGHLVNVTVEIADTEPSRELGLMFRPSIPPDAGMLFDFGGDANSGFWMQNTILPLSIAFIKADGTILDVKDMQPLDTTTISAPGPYRYALETNQGFFKVHHIAPGDRVAFPGRTSAIIPGMPACYK